MIIKTILLMSTMLSFSAFAVDNDFDKVCGYFEQLDSILAKNKKVMNNTQQADFISQLVKKELYVNSSAREAWEVIIYAVPEERYGMYKFTAEEILKSSWQCGAMKKHISHTGE